MTDYSNNTYILAGVTMLWILPSFIVASFGSNKPIGYWRVFAYSMIFSPLIGFIIGIASKPFPPVIPEYKCRYCDFITNENSHYCQRCGRDDDGYTMAENQTRFAKA